MLADLVGHAVDELRQLRVDAGVDGGADRWRRVSPQLRVLAAQDPLDQLVHLVGGGREDVLGDLVGVEPLVELGGAPQPRDALVDGDGPHLRRTRGDDPLPPDATLRHTRDRLQLARQQPVDGAEPGDRDTDELDGVEEELDPDVVRGETDEPGDDGDRQQ